MRHTQLYCFSVLRIYVRTVHISIIHLWTYIHTHWWTYCISLHSLVDIYPNLHWWTYISTDTMVDVYLYICWGTYVHTYNCGHISIQTLVEKYHYTGLVDISLQIHCYTYIHTYSTLVDTYPYLNWFTYISVHAVVDKYPYIHWQTYI